MNTNQLKALSAVKEMDKAVHALYAQVPEEVAQDVQRRFNVMVEEVAIATDERNQQKMSTTQPPKDYGPNFTDKKIMGTREELQGPVQKSEDTRMMILIRATTVFGVVIPAGEIFVLENETWLPPKRKWPMLPSNMVENNREFFLPLPKLDYGTAVKRVMEELRKDQSEGSMYYAFQANIAMAFVDQLKPGSDQERRQYFHELANRAAKSFLDSFIK